MLCQLIKMPVNIAYSVCSQKPQKTNQQKWGVELKIHLVFYIQIWYKLQCRVWQGRRKRVEKKTSLSSHLPLKNDEWMTALRQCENGQRGEQED